MQQQSRGSLGSGRLMRSRAPQKGEAVVSSSSGNSILQAVTRPVGKEQRLDPASRFLNKEGLEGV